MTGGQAAVFSLLLPPIISFAPDGFAIWGIYFAIWDTMR
jgi:hypothetical protein